MSILLESFIISITANIATNVGEVALKKISNGFDKDIKDAYQEALKEWSSNSQIRDRQKIWAGKRFEQLIECIKDPNKVKELNSEITSFLTIYKQKLQRRSAVWNFINDIQFQHQLEKINSFSLHLEKLEDSIDSIKVSL